MGNSKILAILTVLGDLAWLCLVLWVIPVSGCALFQTKPDVSHTNPGPTVKVDGHVPWSILLLPIIGGVASLVAGLFLPGFGRIGGIGAAASLATIAIILMIAKYANWIATGSLIGCMVLLVYIIFRKAKNIRELVATVEIIKERIPNQWDNIKAHINQSSSTQKVVKQIKAGMKGGNHEAI